MTRIAVISDTHARSLKELPQGIVQALAESDYVVHCGDFTHLSLLTELRLVSRHFVGVHGNVDQREVREELPAKTVFEVEGRRIGVIHPHWGGAPFGIEEAVAQEFHGVDLILFGHTHDIYQAQIGDVLLVNPGQAYPDFRTPASMALVTIGENGIDVQVRVVE